MWCEYCGGSGLFRYDDDDESSVCANCLGDGFRRNEDDDYYADEGYIEDWDYDYYEGMTRERYKEICGMYRILARVCPKHEIQRRLIALYGNDALRIWRSLSVDDDPFFGFTGWVDFVRYAEFMSMCWGR